MNDDFMVISALGDIQWMVGPLHFNITRLLKLFSETEPTKEFMRSGKSDVRQRRKRVLTGGLIIGAVGSVS